MITHKRIETLMWFVTQMRDKLSTSKNLAKGDNWCDHSVLQLRDLLSGEMTELDEAVDSYLFDMKSITAEDIISECVDVASFAMMLADKLRTYSESP